MKRARLKSGMKTHSKTRLHSSHHHPHFKTQLKHLVSKIADETGHPFEVLEERFMIQFHKLPLKKQYAVSHGVGIGGMYATAIVAGTLLGSPVLGALYGVPMVAVAAGQDISMRRKLSQKEKEYAELTKD